jgi:hypothetical protein
MLSLELPTGIYYCIPAPKPDSSCHWSAPTSGHIRTLTILSPICNAQHGLHAPLFSRLFLAFQPLISNAWGSRGLTCVLVPRLRTHNDSFKPNSTVCSGTRKRRRGVLQQSTSTVSFEFQLCCATHCTVHTAHLASFLSYIEVVFAGSLPTFQTHSETSLLFTS